MDITRSLSLPVQCAYADKLHGQT